MQISSFQPFPCVRVKRHNESQDLNDSKKLKPHFPWENKKLQKSNWKTVEGSDDIIEQENILINGIAYSIEKIGGGQNHHVFKFTEDKEIKIHNQTVKCEEVALKILNPENTSVKKQTSGRNFKYFIENEDKAYKLLLENKVPVAKVYTNPINYTEEVDPKNGMFWIVEKMESPIDGAPWSGNQWYEELDPLSKKVLDFAKYWLTKMAETKTDIINDFRLRNTMLDKEGSIKVIDYSCTDGENDSWESAHYLDLYVQDWANNNENIKEYLTSNFPK